MIKNLLCFAIFFFFSHFSFAEISFGHFGFLKGSIQHTDKEMANNYKPFWAKDDTNFTDIQKKAQQQFSIKQSRWGLKINEDELRVHGKFEFDLDGQGGNSPGVVSSSTGIIRVRQANAKIVVSEQFDFTIGKKWTRFMGVLPHTYNVTTVNYFAGNTGFLVDGIDFHYASGNFHGWLELYNNFISYTVGSDNYNFTTQATGLTFEYKAEKRRAGVSYVGVSLPYSKADSTQKDNSASGTKVYYADVFGALDLRLEYYMGSNLKSVATGALVAASTSTGEKTKETGYFASFKYTHDKNGFYINYGSSSYDDSEKAGASALNTNTLTRVGIDHKCSKNLTYFFEYSAFTTAWNQATATESKDFSSAFAEAGMIYKF